MGVVNTIGFWYFKKRAKKVFEAIDNACEIQNQTFLNLIENGKNTSFGIEHHFNEIKNYEDFKKFVPTRKYEEFFPAIEKILNGEQNVLWNTEIQWFAKSSGTTNAVSKFIPLSFESLEECHFEAGKDALALHSHFNNETKLFEGKGLLIGGSNKTNPANNKSNYGDLSAVLMHEMPLWASLIKTPDLSIALLENWDEKVTKMAQATMKENVTSISGVPTWTLVVLKKVLALSNKKTIAEVWPNLELYIHGGINFAPYKNQFEKLIGKSINYLETYNASEGFFGMQIGNQHALTLMPHYGIFYEFKNLKTNQIVNLANIELLVDYEIVITTQSGLWRYQLGDTIQFTNKQPAQFIITGRTKSFINAFGEELMVHNADLAIENTCKKHQVGLVDYTAAPIFYEKNQVGTHEWLIQLNQLPADLAAFKQDLDNALQETNSDYQAKRNKNLAMGFPEIIVSNQPIFKAWLDKHQKLGGQHKVPRLCNDRKVIDEIKTFLSE